MPSRLLIVLFASIVLIGCDSSPISSAFVVEPTSPDPYLIIGGQAVATIGDEEMRMSTTNAKCQASLNYDEYCDAPFDLTDPLYDGDWEGDCKYIESEASFYLGHKTVEEGGFRAIHASWKGVSGLTSIVLDATVDGHQFNGECPLGIQQHVYVGNGASSHFFGRVEVKDCKISSAASDPLTTGLLSMYFNIKGCSIVE